MSDQDKKELVSLDKKIKSLNRIITANHAVIDSHIITDESEINRVVCETYKTIKQRDELFNQAMNLIDKEEQTNAN